MRRFGSGSEWGEIGLPARPHSNTLLGAGTEAPVGCRMKRNDLSHPLDQNGNWKGGRTISSHGYARLKMPGHRLADCVGYVYEHRLVAEQAIRRPLAQDEIVHHRNGDTLDNRPENLEVVANVASHKARHRKKNTMLRQPGETNAIISCACGCRQALTKYDDAGRPRRYARGCSWRKGKNGGWLK